MYVAVKGGEQAIENAHQLLASDRRGDPSVSELDIKKIREQLFLAVDRVMMEGALYDPDLAALAIKQACGDLLEAIFLLRAYRTTLPRLVDSEPLETVEMQIDRRISAIYKDLPGGQVLGPTFDYTHRLLDFALAAETLSDPEPPATDDEELATSCMHAVTLLEQEGLIETPSRTQQDEVDDLTRQPLAFPASRSLRLQNLARADEGFLLSMAYSTQRGYGRNHPFVGEIRMGNVSINIVPEELGFEIDIGDIELTECEMVTQFQSSSEDGTAFTRGYGLVFGRSERKAMAMALADRALRAEELGEEVSAPAQDEEFMLYHSDNVAASGFVQHLKLPHYVDFQGELELLRRLREPADKSEDDLNE